MATTAEPTNEPSLLDGLRAAAAGQFDGPIHVPKDATPVKDSSGAITAFHWTPAPTVRQRLRLERGAGHRTRVALPRRSARGCGRPAAVQLHRQRRATVPAAATILSLLGVATG